MAHSTYTRDEIQQRLLNAARELFMENDIAGTEMKMVAEHSGLSRSTLYRYSRDKEQLVFKVSLEVMTEFTDALFRIRIDPGDTGYDKLYKFSVRMIDVLTENPAIIRFMSEFDRLYPGEYPDIPEAKEYSIMMNRLLNRDAQYLFEGMTDGSIRPQEHPLQFISVLVNTVLGLAERMIPRDSIYRREHLSGSRAIMDKAVQILMESIKAQ